MVDHLTLIGRFLFVRQALARNTELKPDVQNDKKISILCHFYLYLSLATTLITHAAFAGDTLQHDPFVRPVLTPITPPVVAGLPTAAEAPWNPKLISVMLAGKHSMVNVDGTIIKIGEEKEGYRLVKVRDHEAEFSNGNKRIVLNMDMATSSQNEARSSQ